MIDIIIPALWFIFPAYLANSSAAFFKGKTPIDGGRKFSDKQPIFGMGKTVEGFSFAVVAGTFVSYAQSVAYPLINMPNLIEMNVALGFLLAFGAMFGDLCGSFIKRRMGMPRGAPAPLLDQLDFIFGAILFSTFVAPLNAEMFMILIIITPIIHLMTNIFGYFWKIKKEPW
ncbi:MAG: CDP-2,3-bis-(O-geranylgeranyl)-sn-glycerol synthase [Candidatus Aenigmatarchaeota archaeon]